VYLIFFTQRQYNRDKGLVSLSHHDITLINVPRSALKTVTVYFLCTSRQGRDRFLYLRPRLNGNETRIKRSRAERRRNNISQRGNGTRTRFRGTESRCDCRTIFPPDRGQLENRYRPSCRRHLNQIINKTDEWLLTGWCIVVACCRHRHHWHCWRSTSSAPPSFSRRILV